MVKKSFKVTDIVNEDGCFDLQFRKDTRKERTNAPTYYRWSAQFVVTAPKTESRTLKKIQKELGVGSLSISKNQARLSVQKLKDIAEIIIPFFQKNALSEKKKKDFSLWAKGVEIIYKNKGKPMRSWKKNEIFSLIEIQKSSAKYKKNPRASKWMEMAHMAAKNSA